MDQKKETITAIALFLALVAVGFAVNYYFEMVADGFSYFSFGIMIVVPSLIAFAFTGLKYSKIWMIGALIFSGILYFLYLFGSSWPTWIQMSLILAAGIYLIFLLYLKTKAEKEALMK